MDARMDKVALFALERGPASGPAAVFLHHFGGTGRLWLPVIERLEGEYRCVAPDLRGFGRSKPGERRTVAAMADDLEVLVHGLTSFVLVGHSMGGKVALELAARRPAGLTALVLVAPSPPTPEPITDPERSRLYAAHGDRRALLERNRAVAARDIEGASLEALLAANLAASPEGWAGWLGVGSQEDISGRVGTIAAPVHVLAGERDQNIPLAVIEREVVARLPGSRLTVMPGAGHLLLLEAPDEVAAAVREALEGGLG